MGLMFLSVVLSTTLIVSADGPNYMGFTPTPKDVTVGDSFRFDVYGDIHSQIDTISVQNMTFLPAGVVNYTSTARGLLFNDPYTQGYEVMWHAPAGASIKNALGWAKYWLWNFDVPGYGGRINNLNATAFNITWLAKKVGTATLTITSGGTAANGVDPGTTKLTGTVRVHPQKPTSLTATPINMGEIDLSWTKHVGEDKTVIVYKTGSNPTSVTDGTILYNDTGSSTSHTGLSGGDHIYYSAWGWNNTAGFFSLDYGTADGKTNIPPSFSTMNPSNGSTGIDKARTSVSIYISNPDGPTFDWTIQGAYVTSASANGASNGTKSASLITPLPYDVVITWFVNATDGIDYTRAVYHFTVRSEYAPTGPSSFNAIAYGRFQINLTWTKGAGGDKTVIVAKLGSAPSGPGDGTIIYNSTGSSYNNGGLQPNQHWYYVAYSWNNTDSVYSASYGHANYTTVDDQAPASFTFEAPTDNHPYKSVYNEYLRLTVSDPEADTMNITFHWGNGTVIHWTTISNGSQASLSLPTYMTPGWLEHDTTYTWYVSANDSWKTGTSSTYSFHTSQPWDVNEDGIVDYLDASGLVSAYGNTCTPGQIGADIDNSGVVDYLDASSLVSHYEVQYYP